MKELKCPFCGQELEETMFARGRVFVSCNNPKCPVMDWGGCSKQIITELIRTKELLDIESSEHELCHDAMVKRTEEVDRTRKALDAAIRGLDQMTWGCDSTDAEYLLKEIKEITAPEQKDK